MWRARLQLSALACLLVSLQAASDYPKDAVLDVKSNAAMHEALVHQSREASVDGSLKELSSTLKASNEQRTAREGIRTCVVV